MRPCVYETHLQLIHMYIVILRLFISCHRKYNQSDCRKTVVYSTVLWPTFPWCVAILFPLKLIHVLASVFSVAWYKIVMDRFLVVYHGIPHLSLVCFFF